MSLHRIRARIRFTNSSGLATWARDQMAVRHGQAVHINEGLENEEPKYNETFTAGPDHTGFRCDLPLMDAAHAQDAFNTLTAGSVFHPAHVSAFPGEDGPEPSFVEYHLCKNGDTPTQPCEMVDRAILPED